MKKTYSILLSAAALALITFSGCKKSSHDNDSANTPLIDVAEAVTDSITLYETFPGTVLAANTVDVAAEVNGKINERLFSSGDYVTKGQPLFIIESTSYRDAVAKSEAALATAKSQLEYYTRQHAAMTKAFQADAVSQMEVLQAQSNMEQAAASVKTAQAALSTARLNLSHCTIRAQMSGYIAAGSPGPGNYVSGEGSPMKLTTIYDNTSMIARFYLSDTQYEQLLARTGGIANAVYRNVPLKFKEKIGHDYTTDLYYVAPNVDESTGSLRLQGTLSNINNELRDGMYTTISLPYGTEPQAILVKDASVGSDQRGKYLYTVNDSDKVVYTPVQVGALYRDSLRVITSGIKPGTKYVTKALMTVRQGEKINPRLTK